MLDRPEGDRRLSGRCPQESVHQVTLSLTHFLITYSVLALSLYSLRKQGRCRLTKKWCGGYILGSRKTRFLIGYGWQAVSVLLSSPPPVNCRLTAEKKRNRQRLTFPMVFLLGSGRPLNDSSHETAVTHQETWHLRSGMVEDIILDQLHSFFFFVELVQDNMSTTPPKTCNF